MADYILTDERTRQLLDKNSGIIVGEIRQQLTQYDGVLFIGTLNFGGFMLNVFSVDETYEDETGKSARYFPATAAMVTAPDCGHMMYGSITQMDYRKACCKAGCGSGQGYPQAPSGLPSSGRTQDLLPIHLCS